MAKKAKSKEEAKANRQQKRFRRKWVTFFRMLRYGVNNFTRNAWLTIAATAVMTITLFVILIGVMSQNILNHTVDQVRDRVTMSIYLKTDVTAEQAGQAVSELQALSTVVRVDAISPSEARDTFISESKNDATTLNAVKEATNKFPWTLSIKVIDINDTTQLREFVATNAIAQPLIDPNRPPSFDGDRRAAIETIASTANFIQQVSIVVGGVLVAISMLIIFNTIRMAIFNRREEIQMMKLIGAERSFIRGPFLVEAIVYGFFAAIIATGLCYAILVLAAPALITAQVHVQPTLDLVTIYAGLILLAMIIIGAIIGIISSLFATRRYLKV